MTVYALAQLNVHDRPRYERYVARFSESLAGFDGRLLAADTAPEVIEGQTELDKVVIIAFADRRQFERWATSPTYQEISQDRTASTTGTVLLISGTDEAPRSATREPAPDATT